MEQTAFVWDFAPELFDITLAGFHIAPRYYGLCFATGILLGYHVMRHFFFKAGRSEEDLNSGFVLFVVGTILGARIGHCLFYEPAYYLAKPWEILMIWRGGLASHGGVIGIFLCMMYYTRKYKISFMWLADHLALGIALGVPFIRIGNFFNSEIVGKATDLPWAVIFKRHDLASNLDLTPRHPAQLYEALAYFAIFGILAAFYKFTKGQFKSGKLLGILFITVFTARFFIEFVKERQVAFEDGMALNMGQLLSIPMVGFGLFFFLGFHENFKYTWAADKPKESTEPADKPVKADKKSTAQKNKEKKKKRNK